MACGPIQPDEAALRSPRRELCLVAALTSGLLIRFGPESNSSVELKPSLIAMGSAERLPLRVASSFSDVPAAMPRRAP